jgi:hypothetical protein
VSMGAPPKEGRQRVAERTRYNAEWQTKILVCRPACAVTSNSNYTATIVTTTEWIMNWRRCATKHYKGHLTWRAAAHIQHNSQWWAPWRHTMTSSRRSLLTKRHKVSRHERNVIYANKKSTAFHPPNNTKRTCAQKYYVQISYAE